MNREEAQDLVELIDRVGVRPAEIQAHYVHIINFSQGEDMECRKNTTYGVGTGNYGELYEHKWESCPKITPFYTNYEYRIKPVEVKDLTVEQISKELGYEVRVIK